MVMPLTSVPGLQVSPTFPGGSPPPPSTPPPIALFVDPQNSTGFAADANSGQTANNVPPGSGPILTTTEENRRIRANRDIRQLAPFTILYMSEDLQALGPNPVGLDTSALWLGAPVTVKMTRVVLRATAGTFNAGTVAINPSAGGGGQRQTAHVTDIADWGPFVFNQHSLGGTATIPARIFDTQAAASAWIMAGAGRATASLSRPVDEPVTSFPAIVIGDRYTIERPGVLHLPEGAAPVSDNALLTFVDCAFTLGSIGPGVASGFSPTAIAFTHCAWLGPLFVGGTLNDCYNGDGAQGTFVALMTAGGWLPNNNTDAQAGLLFFQADTYVTGDSSLNVGRAFYQCVEILGGIQIQDVQIEGPGIFYQQGGTLAVFSLIWGNGNTSVGVAMGPGTTLALPIIPTPSITGASGDIQFELNSGAIQLARAVVNGAYTEAGGPAVRATTWALLNTAIGAGGFGGAMCVPEAQSAILVNS